MPFVSENLKHLLNLQYSLDEPIDLATLSQRVASNFGGNAGLAKALLQPVAGKMKRGTLGLHLLEMLKSDSAVRDIQTTGHLAKFLSRLDVFHRTVDYRIVGMPNRLFDRRSQEERAEYFEHGASLELESEAFESAETQAMLNRESTVLDKHRFP